MASILPSLAAYPLCRRNIINVRNLYNLNTLILETTCPF